MKKIITVLFAAVLSMQLMAQDSKLNPGDIVPSLQIEMMDGTTVNTADLRGKVVVLNFWATWCPYCIQELDHIMQVNFLSRYTDEDLVFIAVSRGEEKQTVATYAGRKGYTFPIGLDKDETVFKTFADKSIPRTYVIGRDGVITGYEIGYTPEIFEQLTATIDETLKTTK